MNERQTAHYEALMVLLEALNREKYTRGAIEHSGVLGDLTDEQLFEAETEEILDLVNYRLSRLLRRSIIES